jgi:hypothetical protein
MNKLKLIFLASYMVSIFSFANESSIGRIVALSGGGFVSVNGQTKEMRKGMEIYPNSEVVIEHNGSATFADNKNHLFHFGNSTSVAITERGIDLRSGDMWIQSKDQSGSFKVGTANSLTELTFGEAILTYETSNGKTQLLVLNGAIKFSNLKTQDLNLTVSEGNFSFIDYSYDEGAPRDPTPVGNKTYHAMIDSFKGVNPMDKNTEKLFRGNENTKSSSEHVAKNDEGHSEVKAAKNGKIISREIASVKNSDLETYKASLFEKNVAKKSKMNYKSHSKSLIKKIANSGSTPFEVKIFGQKNETLDPLKVVAKEINKEISNDTQQSRMPASVVESVVSDKEAADSKKNSIENKETNKLLDQIKSL